MKGQDCKGSDIPCAIQIKVMKTFSPNWYHDLVVVDRTSEVSQPTAVVLLIVEVIHFFSKDKDDESVKFTLQCCFSEVLRLTPVLQ